MSKWAECTYELFYADERTSQMVACEVLIVPGRIVVDYAGEVGRVLYEGTEVGPDHYCLTCPSLRGEATLHRLDDILEGWWREGNVEGMWRVTLGTADLD